MAVLRICSRCKQAKPPEDFYWKDKAKGWRASRCKVCSTEASVERRRADPERERAYQKAYQSRIPLEKRRRWRLRRSALECGLDPDVVEKHYDSHSGLCDSCGRPPQEATQPKTRLSIDHDHASGEFRGLLCHDCNLLIGLADDDPKRLLAAAAYLESRS